MSQSHFQTSKLVPPQDGRDITGKADPSAHGDGPLNITLTPSPIKVNFAIEDVAKESSGQFGYNLDYNSGNTIGIGEHTLRSIMMCILNVTQKVGYSSQLAEAFEIVLPLATSSL